MTDIPLPAQNSTNWMDWATEQEDLSDTAREIVSGRLTDAALRASYERRDPFRKVSLFRGAPIIATRSGNPGSIAGGAGLSNGTDTSSVGRFKHKAVTDIADVRFVYSNVAGGSAGLNPITVAAAVEMPDTTLLPVLFNGRQTAVIDPGGYVVSDPLPLPPSMVAGTVFWSRTYVAVTSGQKWPLNTTSSNAGEGTVTNGAIGLLASGTVPNSFTFGYAPVCAIGGTVNAVRSLAVVGDSIAAGQGDAPAPFAGGDPGYIQRAAYSANLGYVTLARPGEQATQFVAPTVFTNRFGLVAGCTHAVVQYGINDVNTGRSLAQMQGDALTLWRAVSGRGVICFQTTITPSSTATNTVPASNDAVRTGFNDWLRAGAPISPTTGAAVAVGTSGAVLAGTTGHPLTGYFEIADIAETARNSGLWKAGYSDDGTHPNTTGHTALAAGVDTSLFVLA